MRKLKLDWNVEVFGDSHHDISAIDPKDIIEEKGPEKEKASFACAETETFEGHDGEENSKNVIEGPVASEKEETYRNR